MASHGAAQPEALRPRVPRAARPLLLALACIPALAIADVDDSAYDTATQRTTSAARRAMDQQFERERKLEEARDGREREEVAANAAARLAELAARPYPVRLLESRCTECHKAGHYMEQSHSLPGWWFVVLRMKYLNDAELEIADIPVLASHLTAIRGAGGLVAVVEYAALPALLAASLLAGGWVQRRRVRARNVIKDSNQ